MAWLGGGVASGWVGMVAVSPLVRVRIARTVACAICAAVAMSRWASPSRVARAIAWLEVVLGLAPAAGGPFDAGEHP